MNLSGEQCKELKEALIDAFPKESSLEQMLFYELEKKLNVIVGGKSLQDIVFNLIKLTESEGWTKDLIYAACKSNPGNKPLKDFAGSIGELTESLDQSNPGNKPSIGDVERAGIEKPNPPRTLKKPEIISVVDYTQLEKYLSTSKWEEADQETTRIMLKMTHRQKEGWLRIRDVEQLSCSELCVINQLWDEYSKGRFGFGVQRQIWLSLGGQLGIFNRTIFSQFCECVGWSVKNNLLQYYNFNFTSSAPKGHFPSLRQTVHEDGNNRWQIVETLFKNFLSRTKDCLFSTSAHI